MNDSPILWEESIQPGATWSHVLKRGTALRMTDVDGGANAAAVFYNFECPVERYNMPDTLKAQHIARLTKGCVLYSDMGRILCSITDDTVGWHDPLGGVAGPDEVAAKYGRSATRRRARLLQERARQYLGRTRQMGTRTARPYRQREFLQPRRRRRQRRYVVSRLTILGRAITSSCALR